MDEIKIDHAAKYFIRQIPKPGSRNTVTAHLTYSVDNRTLDERAILLASYHKSFVSDDLRNAWKELVNETEKRSSGNFYQDKHFVSVIKSNPGKYRNLGIAVHHFGPVPIMYTGIFHKVELHDQIVDAEVVLYYNRTNSKGDLFKGMFPTDFVLLESLKDDFSKVMLRYMEDVSQILRAISRQADLASTFEWAKLAEDFTGRSIQSKLKRAVPKLVAWRNWKAENYQSLTPLEHVTCELYDQEHDEIYLAQYFRFTVLYFLNELYSHIGLESKSKDYLKNIDSNRVEYDSLKGQGASAHLEGNFGILKTLSQIRKLYQEDELDRLEDVVTQDTWIDCIKYFAVFLLYLNRLKVSPIKGRLFLSYTHNSRVPELVKRQIESYFQFHHTNEIEVLKGEKLDFDDKIRDSIQSLIWSADRTIVIVPKDMTKLGREARGTYEWLAIEAEHALLLRQKVNYFIEEGFDKEAFEKELKKENLARLVPMALAYPRGADRAEALFKDFKRRKQVMFSMSGKRDDNHWANLDSNLREALDHNYERAVKFRHNNLVKGYLHMFSEDNLILLKCISTLGKNRTKKEFVKALKRKYSDEKGLPFKSEKSCERIFTAAWDNFRNRSLVILGEKHALMRKDIIGKSHQYSSNLKRILKALQPNLKKEEIENWMEKLFDQVLPDKAKGI